MSRVIHFEIPATDPERAAAFYKKAATTAAHNPAGAYARPLATKKIS